MFNLKTIYLKLQFLFLLITMKQFSYANHQKLLLTIYYESKCPDSKTFILQQLLPTMQLLHNDVDLKFVPFGKARSIHYGDKGFECQHGPSECLGNIVQDCSLHLMKSESDMKKLDYVACEMETEAGSQGKFDCTEKANLPSALVERCVLTGKGTVLQLESEHYTNMINPKFIPTVTVNDVFDQNIQDNSQVDLFGTLCSVLLDAQSCARHYNHIALNHLLYAQIE